jgi:hypothetical protein
MEEEINPCGEIPMNPWDEPRKLTSDNLEEWDYEEGCLRTIQPFSAYQLPLVRRVYPNMMANELVSVQPMTSPESLVFHTKYKFNQLDVGTIVWDNGRLYEITSVGDGPNIEGKDILNGTIESIGRYERATPEDIVKWRKKNEQ